MTRGNYVSSLSISRFLSTAELMFLLCLLASPPGTAAVGFSGPVNYAKEQSRAAGMVRAAGPRGVQGP